MHCVHADHRTPSAVAQDSRPVEVFVSRERCVCLSRRGFPRVQVLFILGPATVDICMTAIRLAVEPTFVYKMRLVTSK